MATIKIDDMHFTGANLFSDSESYLDELSNVDTLNITGGVSTPICVIATAASVAASAAAASYAIEAIRYTVIESFKAGRRS